MANDKEKFERLADLVDQVNSGKIPEGRIRREHKDHGLIERTEESLATLTEDNKFLLND